MSPRDEALVQRWRRERDADAFAELAGRYAGMVYATCRRILGDAAEAEDVAQECFLRLASSEPAVRTSLGGWLHALAMHRSLDRLRSARRRAARERQYAETVGGVAETDVDELERHVDEAIASLPEKYRVPLVTHFFEGRRYEDIAQALGIPRSTAAYRVQRAVELVRRALRKRGIVVPAAALASALAAQTAEAAPATLTATLTRLAIAGASSPAATAAIDIGGILVMKKAIVAITVVAAVVLLWLAGRAGAPAAPKPAAPAEERTAAPVMAANAPGTSAATARAADAPKKRVGFGSIPDDAGVVPAEAVPAVVSGRATDPEGAPVAGAEVEVAVSRDRLAYEVIKRFSARTDNDGRYIVEGIDAEGFAKVSAAAEGRIPEPLHSTSREFPVEPGMRRDGCDFVLAPADLLVEGQVVDEARRPVPDACVDLSHYTYTEDMLAHGETGSISNAGFLARAYTDEHGRFRQPLDRDGLCDFRVSKPGFGPGFFPRLSPGTQGVVLVLHRDGVIAGRVTRADGRPAAGVTVEAMGLAGIGGLPLDDGVSEVCQGIAALQTDANGRYEISGLGADFVYTVAARDAAIVAEYTVPKRPDWDDTLRELGRYGSLYDLPESPRVKRGVRVRPGQTTRVNLVFTPCARAHGRITAKDSGKPVHPFCVEFYSVSPENLGEWGAKISLKAKTDEDGRYTLALELDKPAPFRAAWMYWHLGGGDTRTELPQDIELRPGEDAEFNFSVPAPITVPVRFVDEKGQPYANVYAGVQHVTSPGGRRGSQPIGPDGRTVLVGLPPDMEQRVLAISTGQEPLDRRTVGVSETFIGKSGETLPEITVVCMPHGGIAATLVDIGGTPIAGAHYGCRARRSDGSYTPINTMETDAQGRFSSEICFPEGEYAEVYIGNWLPERDGETRMATVQDVGIAPDAVTDLGTVTVVPVPLEAHAAVFGG